MFTRRSHGLLAALTFATASAPPCAAQVIVNFDTYPNNQPVIIGDVFTTQWAQAGVIFSDGGASGPGPANNACSYSPPNHAAASGLIVARFIDPCTGQPSATTMAGTRQDLCWVNGEGIDMYAYDANGVQIGHQFNAGGGNLVTFTFATPIIARLDMFHIGQGIDDFTFDTPAAVPDACPADTNDDHMVNVSDLLAVIIAWGPCPLGVCAADIDCDRMVSVADLLAVIASWGPCP